MSVQTVQNTVVKRVIFPLNIVAGGVIQYPDNITKFSNVVIIDNNLIADYSGVLPLAEYSEVDIGQFFTTIEYLRLFSPFPDKEKAIRTAAKENILIEMFFDRLKDVGGCYTKHPETLAGLGVLQAAGLLTASDVERLKEGLPLLTE